MIYMQGKETVVSPSHVSCNQRYSEIYADMIDIKTFSEEDDHSTKYSVHLMVQQLYARMVSQITLTASEALVDPGSKKKSTDDFGNEQNKLQNKIGLINFLHVLDLRYRPGLGPRPSSRDPSDCSNYMLQQTVSDMMFYYYDNAMPELIHTHVVCGKTTTLNAIFWPHAQTPSSTRCRSL